MTNNLLERDCMNCEKTFSDDGTHDFCLECRVNPNKLPEYAKDLAMSDIGLTEDEADMAIEEFNNPF